MCLFIVPPQQVYNVFDPSYSQSVLVFFVSPMLLKLLNKLSWNCSYTPFELRNLAKIEYTTVTVCQRNSSRPLKRILWKFVVDKDILCTWWAYLQKILIWFIPERKIHYFVQLVWNWFTMIDREAVQSNIFLTVNVQMLHKWYNYYLY